MRIYRMFVYLCLSGLLVLSGCLHDVNADEYDIMPTMILNDELVGYVSLVDTGSDEWGSVIEYIRINVSSAESYACQFNTYGSIVCGYNYRSYSNSSKQITWSKYAKIEVNANNGDLIYSTGGTAYTLLYEGPILCMSGVPDSVSTSSGITNLNAISFDDMELLYLSSSEPNGKYQEIIDAINGQWEMDDSDNLGVDSLVPEVENKLGVLGFASDTLIQFVDLFNPNNASGTSLTFPSFTINVSGEAYQLWPDIIYDLNSLYEHFSFLIDTVRSILTLFVWIAVFNYLVKEYERFVNP